MIVKNIKQAVLSTAAFFDIFDFAPSLDELEYYLFGPIKHQRHHLASYIKESPLLTLKNAVFFLQGRDVLEKRREQKKYISEKHWGKSTRLIRKLAYLPFLKAVCVCNNLAYNNADENSDIDLFIIAAKNRLFLVRTLVTLVTHLAGVRRHGQKISGRVCLSFFVSEDALNLSMVALRPLDIYLAFWLKTLKPVLDRGVMTKFEKNNRKFMKKYFPGIYTVNRCRQERVSERAQAYTSFGEWILGGFCGDMVEKMLKRWQLARAEKKRCRLDDNSGVILSETMLKFHNLDRRRRVNELWLNRMRKLLG